MQGSVSPPDASRDNEAASPAPPQARHVILIGLPGVGKTTVGRIVAKRLGRQFFDVDREVEQLFGKPVSRIFAEDGEAAFRRGEAEVSARLGRSPDPLVISPGGGWVTNEPARAHLRGSARIIYLRVSPDEAVRRMGRGVARRPLLASGDPVSALNVLHDRRRQAYEELADLTIDTTGAVRGEVVARVLRLVNAALQNYDDEG